MKKLALPRSWTWKTWSSCLVPTGNASSPTFKVSIAASSWRTKNLSSSHKDLSATPQSYWIIIKYHSPIWVLSLSHSLPTLFGSFNLIYFIDAFNSHFLLFLVIWKVFFCFLKKKKYAIFPCLLLSAFDSQIHKIQFLSWVVHSCLRMNISPQISEQSLANIVTIQRTQTTSFSGLDYSILWLS